jgi:hypothetical protein
VVGVEGAAVGVEALDDEALDSRSAAGGLLAMRLVVVQDAQGAQVGQIERRAASAARGDVIDAGLALAGDAAGTDDATVTVTLQRCQSGSAPFFAEVEGVGGLSGCFRAQLPNIGSFHARSVPALSRASFRRVISA